MTHLDESDLILLHYGESVPAGAREHLARCEACEAGLLALQNFLASLPDEVPDPAAGFEDAVWQRLRWRIGHRSGLRSMSVWYSVAAAAVLLLLGFVGGRLLPSSSPSDPARRTAMAIPTKPAEAAPAAATPQELALSLAAADHLDRTSRLLLEVTNETSGDPDELHGRRDAAKHLVASNRLYRKAATGGRSDELAALLEELEPILVELLHESNNLSRDDLASIRKRIRKRDLLFKLRVIAATLDRGQPESSPASSQGNVL